MRPPPWAAHLPLGMAPGDCDVVAEGSLPAAWERAWSEDPGAPALAEAGGRWVGAGELEEASRRAAARLLAAGLEPGDRVVVAAGSSPEMAAVHVGVLRAGLVAVPANPALSDRELAHVVGDCGPRAAYVDSRDQAAALAAACPGLVVAGPGLHGLPPAPADPGLPPAPEPGRPALIAYTSGTTGAPKGAVHSHASLLASARSVSVAWRWGPGDRLVLALPLFHGHGLCVGLHGTLLNRASAVILPRFSPEAVLDAAAEERASLFFGVPTMYHRLASSPRLGELGRLRLCVSGSAPLPPRLHAAVLAGSGQSVLERYGTSETLMNVSNPYDGERRPGAVGLPLPEVEVALDGGEGGEVLVRGPNCFLGYWGRDHDSARALEGGWFRTGDLGAFDHDGYLRILGRSKELIITGGYNVYPAEVEEVLAAHPAVAEVAVVGLASEEWGEQVAAFVVPAGEAPRPEELASFAAARLAPYKRPRVWRTVDALPRNALGKVLRSELARAQ
jgi:malonyl-CoA/methylmalonyl-CoA synthetase